MAGEGSRGREVGARGPHWARIGRRSRPPPHLACAASEQHRVLLLRNTASAASSPHRHGEGTTGLAAWAPATENNDFRCPGLWERKRTVARERAGRLRVFTDGRRLASLVALVFFSVFSQFFDFTFSYVCRMILPGCFCFEQSIFLENSVRCR